MIEQTEKNSIESQDVNEKAILEQNYNYYLEYRQLRKVNRFLINELNSLSKEKKILKNNLNKIEVR